MRAGRVVRGICEGMEEELFIRSFLKGRLVHGDISRRSSL